MDKPPRGARIHSGKAARFLVGADIGSTTVKLVVCSAEGNSPIFRRYLRHGGRQAETLLQCLQQAQQELAIAEDCLRLFLTGSGGEDLARLCGARFVQETAAVSLTVEKHFPEVRTVIELGGQDAKIIFFQESEAHTRKKIASMNDKCAGGTGVIIERIAARLHVPAEALLTESYTGMRIHPVAARCGVFAETDITGLQKQGVLPGQLMASLFHAIVLQNLTVLARGHTPLPKVFLLGGPNAFFPGLREAWKLGLLDLWRQKRLSLPDNEADLIVVPPMAEYFAALGAIEYGLTEPDLTYQGTRNLKEWIRKGGIARQQGQSVSSLCSGNAEAEEFQRRYSIPAISAKSTTPDDRGIFIGIDGGSTSTKAVALSLDGEVLASSYRLSQADPIADAIAVLQHLREGLSQTGHSINVLGMATTGYSRSLLQKVLSADIALVETVAHAKSSLRIFPEVDAIIDVGGQDIKIITLQDGVVKDFRLNTQCSAGNGYFLQAAAEGFGIPVEDFATLAFRARRMPQFSYGCAVFLQSDIVNFQRQGWKPEEILAGLANVLPKNVFFYVAGISNVAAMGRRFVLQGGTQRNLAVVKAEMDFIREHYHGDAAPEVAVHPHCCEAGAIGAALEVREHWFEGQSSSFPGFAFLDTLHYSLLRDETTRCHFCTNRCLRTFVQIAPRTSAAKRVILASCERGEAPNNHLAQEINAAWKELRSRTPNYVQLAAEQAWMPMHPPSAVRPPHGVSILARLAPLNPQRKRSDIRIGIPKALNLYTYAPLFSAWFESLGIPARNLSYSHFTSPEQYAQAAGFSAIDPCFPSKASLAHVYELLRRSKAERLDAIFFPMLDVLTTPLEGCTDSSACPSGAATPEAVKAAFHRTVNWFQQAGVAYINPVLNLADQKLFKYQMFIAWKNLLGLTWDESSRAVEIAFTAWSNFESSLRQQARQTLDELERNAGVGLVMLGRPYHHDPGLNQGILDEFQRLGYPVFSQSLLPLDSDLLDRLFGREVDAGLIRTPLDISDVWKHTFSASSNHKLWAAKFVARHPNLISVELSNFKCGHDAFISRLIEQIIEAGQKPHFSFRDLDENRPLASIRIRVETMHYFLKHYQDRLNIANIPAAEDGIQLAVR